MFWEKASLVFGAAAIVVISVIIVVSINSSGSGNDSSLSQCYVEPSCTASMPFLYNPINGWSNNTGWSNDKLSSSSCCQICPAEINMVTCFPGAPPSCYEKTGLGDYDYLLFDQVWIPQLCEAWSEGHDPTLSHLEGSKCQDEYVNQPLLSIHGLWPNYVGGFPQCCSYPSDPNGIQALTDDFINSPIWSNLTKVWFDPIQLADSCTGLCYLNNHEWEKHGSCYSPNNPEEYFSAGLTLYGLVSSQTEQISLWQGSYHTLDDFLNLFDKSVNVVCDPNDSSIEHTEGSSIFLEFQTCWNKLGDSFVQVDCPAATASQFTVPCGDNIYVR